LGDGGDVLGLIGDPVDLAPEETEVVEGFAASWGRAESEVYRLSHLGEEGLMTVAARVLGESKDGVAGEVREEVGTIEPLGP
jgi:hypothetical protein